MAVIQTEFDGILAEDIILEETDSVEETKDILAHAENIYKANLYLREMFTQAPVFNEVIQFNTIETSDKEIYAVNEESSLIMIKNLKDNESKIFLNDGEFVLLPFESFEFPVATGMKLEIKGRVSIVETKYN